MNPTEVIIKNWPGPNHLSDFSTIGIAVIALGVSLYSAFLSRKSFVMANRPYLWAVNYGFIDRSTQNLTTVASKIAIRVKNAPAKILKMEFKILFDKNQLHGETRNDFVQFPDDSSEWSYSVEQKKFRNILMQANSDITKLERHISFRYSALDGGKEYIFALEQSYILSEGQWRDNILKAD